MARKNKQFRIPGLKVRKVMVICDEPEFSILMQETDDWNDLIAKISDSVSSSTCNLYIYIRNGLLSFSTTIDGKTTWYKDQYIFDLIPKLKDLYDPQPSTTV